MPFLLPFVPAILGAAAAAVAGPGIVGAVVGGLVAAGSALAISGLTRKKTEDGRTDLSSQARARSVIVRSTSEPYRVIVGMCKVSGVLAYREATGANKEHYWLVIVLAAYPCEQIRDVWIDDERISDAVIDTGGNVTAGKFAGLVKIKRYAGADTDNADPDLMAETAGRWTSNHRGRGLCKMYVRLTRNDTVFPSGLPNIQALVKGIKCSDSRDGGFRWTENPALILREYLQAVYGLSAVAATEISDVDAVVAANLCDERVSLVVTVPYASPVVSLNVAGDDITFSAPENRIGTGDAVRFISSGSLSGSGFSTGVTYYAIRTGPVSVRLAISYANAIGNNAINITGTGTGQHQLQHIDQARYTCNGAFTLDQTPRQIIEQLLGSMAGSLVYAQGLFRIFGGAYVSPSVTLTDNDLRGQIEYTADPPRDKLFNTVRPQYVDQFLGSQTTDAPEVSLAALVSADGGQKLAQTLQLPMTTNGVRSQRIARIQLRRGRAGTMRMPCKMTAMQVATWDTVNVTSALLGFSSHVMRVVDYQVSVQDGAGIDLVLTDDAPGDWGWAAVDAVIADPTGPLSIPDKLTVAVPGNVTADSGNAQLLRALDGTIISRIRLSWTAPAEPNLNGYEVRWKPAADAEYNSVRVSSDTLAQYIAPVKDGVDYNLGVRTLGVAGRAASSWADITHTVIGKSAPPTAPTALTAESIGGGVALVWSECPDADYRNTQVWEASTNDRASAIQIDGGSLAGNRMSRTGLATGTIRFYWVRHVDTSGNLSSYFPSSATAGVQGTANWLNANNNVVVPPGGSISSGNLAFVGGQWTGAGVITQNIGGVTTFVLRDNSGNILNFNGTTLTAGGGWAGGGAGVPFDVTTHSISQVIGLIGANTTQTYYFTVPDCIKGDDFCIAAQPVVELPTGFAQSASVTDQDEVGVTITNHLGGSVNLGTKTWLFAILHM